MSPRKKIHGLLLFTRVHRLVLYARIRPPTTRLDSVTMIQAIES